MGELQFGFILPFTSALLSFFSGSMQPLCGNVRPRPGEADRPRPGPRGNLPAPDSLHRQPAPAAVILRGPHRPHEETGRLLCHVPLPARGKKKNI